MCKTNPICRRRAGKTIAKAFGLDDATRHRGNGAKRTQFPAGPGGTGRQGGGTRGNRAKRTQLAPPRWDQRDRSRQTKPIAPVEGVGRGRPTYEERRANRAKQTQFARRCRVGRGQRGVARGANAQNEPNSWIADRFAAGRLPCGLLPQARAGRTCKTNPIWPGLGGAGTRQAKDAKRTQFARRRPKRRGAAKDASAAAAGANRAKRSQFVAEQCGGQVLCGKRVMTNLTRASPRENEANSPRRRARMGAIGSSSGYGGKGAKRTQFPPIRAVRVGGIAPAGRPHPFSRQSPIIA
jgi:hypothetical protein